MSSVRRSYTNARMSKIITHNDTVYLCGQVGNRGESIEEQTLEALSRVNALLGEAGSDKNHILQATVWLSDMSDFAAMNEVWDEWFELGFAPTRACGEAKLASPELLFEVIVTAALKKSS